MQKWNLQYLTRLYIKNQLEAIYYFLMIYFHQVAISIIHDNM